MIFRQLQRTVGLVFISFDVGAIDVIYPEILLSQAKPPTQLNRRVEVLTCRHVSPPTSIALTSKLMKTEPNRPLSLSEDRRHRRM